MKFLRENIGVIIGILLAIGIMFIIVLIELVIKYSVLHLILGK